MATKLGVEYSSVSREHKNELWFLETIHPDAPVELSAQFFTNKIETL